MADKALVTQEQFKKAMQLIQQRPYKAIVGVSPAVPLYGYKKSFSAEDLEAFRALLPFDCTIPLVFIYVSGVKKGDLFRADFIEPKGTGFFVELPLREGLNKYSPKLSVVEGTRLIVSVSNAAITDFEIGAAVIPTNVQATVYEYVQKETEGEFPE